MNPVETRLPVVYLKPAEMYLSHNPSIVKTVLGSCISITMFNHRLKMGAICHGLLPYCKKNTECSGRCNECFKYIDCSIRQMLAKFTAVGIGYQEIEVKLFGGANMSITRAGERETVGMQNIKIALAMIKEASLNLQSSDIGGSRGRKIFFYTHTGEVFLKRLGADRAK